MFVFRISPFRFKNILPFSAKKFSAYLYNPVQENANVNKSQEDNYRFECVYVCFCFCYCCGYTRKMRRFTVWMEKFWDVK